MSIVCYFHSILLDTVYILVSKTCNRFLENEWISTLYLEYRM